MNCAELRLKDPRRVSHAACGTTARAAENLKCFCRGIEERGGARERVCTREGYIEELNYYSLSTSIPTPRPKLPSRIFHLSSGSYQALTARRCGGNSSRYRMTYFRLSGFSIRRDAIEAYDRTTPCPVLDWVPHQPRRRPTTRTGAFGATRGGRLVVGYHPAAS